MSYRAWVIVVVLGAFLVSMALVTLGLWWLLNLCRAIQLRRARRRVRQLAASRAAWAAEHLVVSSGPNAGRPISPATVAQLERRLYVRQVRRSRDRHPAGHRHSAAWWGSE